MNSVPIKILKDENGQAFIPVTSTLGIDSNGKTLNEEVTTILDRLTGINYIPGSVDINAIIEEDSVEFESQNAGVIICEFGNLVTGESLFKIGEYTLKTNVVNSTTFNFELTDGTTSYLGNDIPKDVILDKYNRLIIVFSGTNVGFGINGTSGGFVSSASTGIAYTKLALIAGSSFLLYKLYISYSVISGLSLVTDSALNVDIDRKVRPYDCFLYYRNINSATLINEGWGTATLDWALSQAIYIPGYNTIKDISYPGLSQKPTINGVELVGNKTTEDLLIESGGGSWGEIEGTLSNQTDLQTALDGKVDEIAGKGLSTEDYTTIEKTKLSGIAESANNYTLPVASATTSGGVKVGTRLTMTDGVLSADEQVGGLWGDITGTLADQTDLQTALNGKLNLSGGTMTGGLVVDTPASSWLSGKTGASGINGEQQSQSSYHPLVRQTVYSGDVVNLGGLGNSFGFYGYNQERSANGTDFSLAINTDNWIVYRDGVPMGVTYIGGTPSGQKTGDIWFS